MEITIEGVGFGDADVSVDGDVAYHLIDVDRSFDSAGTKFMLIGHYTGDLIGYVTCDTDVVAQVTALIEGNQ